MAKKTVLHRSADTVAGANVKYRNCRFRGPVAPRSVGRFKKKINSTND